MTTVGHDQVVSEYRWSHKIKSRFHCTCNTCSISSEHMTRVLALANTLQRQENLQGVQLRAVASSAASRQSRLLFLITHFLKIGAGGRSLFIETRYLVCMAL